MQQKLNYRKQIVRKLCTEYIEGISSNPVTLKSRSRVIEGHWKWNHWINHTGLIISELFNVEYYCDLEM